MQSEVKDAQVCPTLCDCIVHGILQARILERVAFSFFRWFSQPRDQTHVSRFAGRFFTRWAIREAQEYWSGWPIPSPVDLPNPGLSPSGVARVSCGRERVWRSHCSPRRQSQPTTHAGALAPSKSWGPPPTCLLSAWPTQTPLRSYFPPLCKVHPLPAPKCASGSPHLWFPVILLLLFLLGGFSAV